MYILINEFNEVYIASEINKPEYDAFEDGILDIINAENLTRFWGEDGWVKIEEWESIDPEEYEKNMGDDEEPTSFN